MIIQHLFLIRFIHDHYCQGYEDARETVLVKAPDFHRAKMQIIDSYRYTNPRDFVDLTIGSIDFKEFSEY